MKLGLVIALNPTPRTAPLLFSGRLLEGLATAQRLGCQGVELNILDPQEVDGAELQRLLRRHELAVCTLATGQAFGKHGLSLVSADPEVRRRTMARLEAHTLLAARLECAVTIGLIRGLLSGDESEQSEGSKRIADGLGQFAHMADGMGVRVLLEPLNRYECNNVNSLPDGLALIEDIGAANLYLLADTFHMNIEDVDMAANLRAAGSRLGYVHLADSNRQAPGSGHTSFAPLIEALRAIGYKRYLSAEVQPAPDDVSAAEQFVRFCRSLGVQG
jgi:sugar phosphate isomerase/epimerase